VAALIAPVRAVETNRAWYQVYDFHIVICCLLAASLIAVYPAAYLCVVVPAIVPAYLWVRAGTPGIPTMPIVAGLSIIYYAIPVLRGDLPIDDDSFKVLVAAATVGLFLLSATATYYFFLKRAAHRQVALDKTSLTGPSLVELTFVGLGSGIAFYLASFAGWFEWIGEYLGVLRAVALTLSSIGCYLAGAARAQGVLRGALWAAALVGLAIAIMFAISDLLLVGGMANILAAILGYVIAARRIPWVTLATTFALINVMQAGKSEIRNEYWGVDASRAHQFELSEIPGVIIDWCADGVGVLWAGGQQIDVLERASLLWIVIRVQDATPDFIPYLEGATYALLPRIILPRFIEPDRVRTQAGLNMLAVHYRFQLQEATDRTTIGFGLIAEACANFGIWAVPVIGALFGALCGLFTLISSGVSLTSVRMFAAIAATSVLLDLEADFSYLLVTMAQALAGVLIAAAAIRFMKASVAPPPGLPDQSAGRLHGRDRHEATSQTATGC
jgi:hypothetical protein